MNDHKEQSEVDSLQCKRCLFDTQMTGVVLDSSGICNYCKIHDKLEKMYPPNEAILDKIVEKIKQNTKNRDYNCILGISGGCDSSYMLWLAKQKGLNPLAVHWDNGWNTDIAEHNMKVVTDKLGIDVVRYKSDESYNELNKAFLHASVKDADIPNDICLLAVNLYTTKKFNIKYNLSGHDFRTEGTCPPCWTFMDRRYLGDVYTGYTGKELSGFKYDYYLKTQIYWGLKGIKTVRPLYYINKDKSIRKEELKQEFGWKDYESHHCENIYTAFVGNYWYPKKFNVDMRITELSAFIRSGYTSKESALKELETPIAIKNEYVDSVIKKYFKDRDEFTKIFNFENKTFEDYGEYFKRFRTYKWLFWLGMKFGIFPVTYYEKYTKDAKFFR